MLLMIELPSTDGFSAQRSRLCDAEDLVHHSWHEMDLLTCSWLNHSLEIGPDLDPAQKFHPATPQTDPRGAQLDF